MNILILSTSGNSKATKAIQNAANKRGHNTKIIDPLNLSIKVSNTDRGYDKIYYKTKHAIIAKDCDAIIPRIGNNINYCANIINHFENNLGIYTPISGTALLNASNKFITLQKCSNNGVRTPKTILASKSSNIDTLISQIGLPIVVKLVHGSLGKGVSILNNKISAKSTIETYLKTDTKVILQEYIKPIKDIRAFVIGNEVVAALDKKPVRGDFRANVSMGAKGIAINLNEKDKAFCINSAKSINLDIAGVDFIKGKNGMNYLLEINSNPGFKIQEITGVDVAQKTIQYIETNVETKSNRLKTDDKIKIADLFLQDTYLNNIYRKAKGKIISYQDKNKKPHKTKIQTKADIYRIMLKTFQIK